MICMRSIATRTSILLHGQKNAHRRIVTGVSGKMNFTVNSFLEVRVMSKLKRCPCGEIPTTLILADNGQGGKWATASGDCCNEWSIEFRTYYAELDSDDCMDTAIEAWNNTPRGFE